MAKKGQSKTILFAVSGSVAAYRVGDVISELRKAGHKVLCLMTEGAKHFITELTLKSLSGNYVYSDPYENPHGTQPIHTGLAAETTKQDDGHPAHVIWARTV